MGLFDDSLNRRDLLKRLGAAALTAALPGLASRPIRAAGPLLVGFLYVGPRDDYGYSQAHAQAAAAIRQIPGVMVLEEENVPETVVVQKSMESMINLDGASLLFPTSFGYFDPHMLRLCGKYPKVQFRHCGGLWDAAKHPRNAGSFFGYIDEGQYLNGVVAGQVSKSGRLGFVAAKPIAQVLRNINAFTLGARRANPAATTRVIFTGDWLQPVKEAEAANSLIDQGCEVLTCHVDSPKVIVETCEKRGVHVCGYHANQSQLAPRGYLTGAEWNWATAYRAMVEDMLQGKTPANFLRGGLQEGYIQTSPYGPAVPEAARRQADAVKTKMLAGQFVIFEGPIVDHRGKTVIPKGKAHPQTDPWLERMDWLVEGVVG